MTEPAVDAKRDSWPHTTRALPWLVALFMVMVFWVPFDSIQLPVSLPINSDLDRFVIAFVFLGWVIALLTQPRAIEFRSSPINVMIYLFLLAASISLIVNLRQLAWDGELELSLKELSLIMSYLAAFFVISTSLRPTEIASFSRLLVVLAAGTAAGTVYQYVTGVNPFFSIAKMIFVGSRVTSAAAGQVALAGPGTRPSITGPTLHPLANATLISTAFPFALCFASSTRQRMASAGWWLAIVLLLAGCFATGRKTALIVVGIDFLVLMLYDPRRYYRYLLAPIVAGVILFVADPHSFRAIFDQVSTASSSSSTTARVADYPAILPDVTSHLLIGRGYGSFDPFKYRILDDQMLDWLVSIGALGAVIYALIILAVPLTVFPAAQRPHCLEDRMMQAVFASSIGYLVTNFLYDTFGFRQAPYTFFIVAGLGVTWMTSNRVREAPRHDPTVSRSEVSEKAS